MNKAVIEEARFKMHSGRGCGGMCYDYSVVCKVSVPGRKKPLYFLYTTEAGYLFGVSEKNLFQKKYETDDSDAAWIDFFMDGYSDDSEQNVKDTEYYPIYRRLVAMAKSAM